MRNHWTLVFGPVAVAILAAGIVGLAQLVPGYNPVYQTVSEIYEVGSPERIPFAAILLLFAVCILIFAVAMRRVSLEEGHSPLAAYFTGFLAVTATGLAVYAYPHPLHNVFGLSELVAYQAPLVLAFTRRGDPQAHSIVRFSWIKGILLWIALALNMSVLDRGGALWAYERPFYALVQRSLFAIWGVWCAGTGLLLFWRGKRGFASVS